MPFVARKSFLYEGTQYVPGDVVKGFPDSFPKSERFIMTGYVVEKPGMEEIKPVRKKSQPKVEVEVTEE
jgi:hypothetical protein